MRSQSTFTGVAGVLRTLPLTFATLLLLVRWLDLFWLVAPELHRDGIAFSYLDAAALRARVAMHNIANQNTPGFKRYVVSFEERLAEAHADGRPVYTPLVGLSLMVFFALACQCMSTVAVVKRETAGYRWPVFLVAYMTVLAWGASFAVYQGGRLLGFG